MRLRDSKLTLDIKYSRLSDQTFTCPPNKTKPTKITFSSPTHIFSSISFQRSRAAALECLGNFWHIDCCNLANNLVQWRCQDNCRIHLLLAVLQPALWAGYGNSTSSCLSLHWNQMFKTERLVWRKTITSTIYTLSSYIYICAICVRELAWHQKIRLHKRTCRGRTSGS